MTSKKKFVPMTGLDSLNEQEKLEYYEGACEYFNIPANQNLLEFIWLDDGNMGKHLVLYAKRGATDIMRAHFGISVDEIKEAFGDGFVAFTAKGHDKTGRSDIAVGSAYTKGLGGRALENAVMTAQTRATRRLTLQLVGGGLLDETEVNVPIETVRTTSEPLQNVGPAPVASMNHTPGRDITDASKLGMLCDHANEVPVICTCKCEHCKTNPLCNDRREQPRTEPIKRIEDITHAIIRANEVPAGVPFVPVQSAPADAPTPLEPLVAVRKPRKRRTVVLETSGQQAEVATSPAPDILDVINDAVPSPGQLACQAVLAKMKSDPEIINAVAASMEDDEVAALEAALATARAKKAAAIAPIAAAAPPTVQYIAPPPPSIAPAVVQATEPPPPAAPPAKNLPKPEQMKEFKDRLFAYTNDILRKGGMKPSEGIGGVEFKMRAFIRKMFPAMLDMKQLSSDQWNTLFGYLDEKLQELNPEGLVNLINEKIGAKE